MPNRLVHETSPYLKQHAENPVDWFPWGEEAFALARQADKPVFLSIGYAACHWCHVMERESFENAEIAEILNRDFISIKVDRDERPDIDHIYMSAVTAMIGQGGWPLNVFLTPEKHPFYGGTYFPPSPRYRLPSFQTVLQGIALAWKTDRAKLIQSSRQITQFLAGHLSNSSLPESFSSFNIPAILTRLEHSFNWQTGGWGDAPKFPQPMTIDFLLMLSSQNPDAFKLAMRSLKSMRLGGIYDLVGGGFHRYSTDAGWRTPHFEKMLTDNALLAQAYLHAFLLSGDPACRQTCEQTLDFILRELSSPEGGFFTSLDADSDGEEGLFYTWTSEELEKAIPDPTQREQFFALHLPFHPKDERAAIRQSEEMEQAPDQVLQRIYQVYATLLEVRNLRPRPAVDDQVIVAFNALALKAFAEAGRYLGRKDYLLAAQKNATFLLDHLYNNRHLFRTRRSGIASQSALLADYASFILALIALYQSDFNPIWLTHALHLAETMMADFSDQSGIFFDSSPASTDLLFRPITWEDSAAPSATAQAASALLWLSSLTNQPDWQNRFKKLTRAAIERATASPLGYASWLQNAFLLEQSIEQIAVLYPPSDQIHHQFIQSIYSHYKPNRIVAASPFPPPAGAPQILQSHQLVDECATFFLCTNFTCQRPLTHPADVERLLGLA